MKIKIKLSMYIFITGLCFLTMGCNKQEKVEYDIESSIKEKDYYIQTIPSETDESYCIISRSGEVPLVLPGKYVIDHYMELDEKYMTKGGYGSDNTLTKLIAYVQDIYTLEIVKEIDVKSLLEPYMEEYQVVGDTMELREENGKFHLEKPVRERYSEDELRERTMNSGTEIKEVWIDIETEETQLREWVKTDGEEQINIWMLVGTGIVRKSISEEACVRNSSYIKNTSYIDIPTVNLSENNKKLYEMFPELKTVTKEAGVYAHIFLVPETNNLEALSLMLDDNKDLDFNVLQADSGGHYGTYGKDGEIHRITKEEYEQFQKEYWEYRKKQREEYGIPQPDEKTEKKKITT